MMALLWRRMHEGEALDAVRLCCAEAKPTTNAAGQPRYWTCTIHYGVAYAPEPLRHAANYRGEGTARTWGTVCGAPIQTSLVAGAGAVNCPACRLKAAPAPAVEGGPPAACKTRQACEAYGCHGTCKVGKPLGEPPEMTLDEACEAKDGTVECRMKPGYGDRDWSVFDKFRAVSPLTLSQMEFRRKPAPALTRVERMVAERFPGTDPASDTEREIVAGRYAEAIRAVCEWLRETEAGHMIDHDLPGRVEREFLGPPQGKERGR